MSIHDGHRQRMKERFLSEGLDNFSEIQVLEMLLFYAVPRQDTNPIAHALLERFGTLDQVLDAPVSELEKVKGVGHNAAILLSLSTALGRRYHVSRMKQTRILTSVEECGKYLVPYFFGRRNETVFILCLDAKCKVLGCVEVGEGSVNSAGVPIRRIVENALALNATTVILAHNHPSGLALPSQEDYAATDKVQAALATIGVELADHIIVADGDYVSMNDSGFLMR